MTILCDVKYVHYKLEPILFPVSITNRKISIPYLRIIHTNPSKKFPTSQPIRNPTNRFPPQKVDSFHPTRNYLQKYTLPHINPKLNDTNGSDTAPPVWLTLTLSLNIIRVWWKAQAPVIGSGGMEVWSSPELSSVDKVRERCKIFQRWEKRDC